MMGITNAVYRRRVYERGCTLAFAAVVDVRKACAQETGGASDQTGDAAGCLAAVAPDEPPVAVQLLGGDPEQCGRAAAAIAGHLGSRLAMLDVNMACPVAPVVQAGAGCALRADSRRAAACMERVRRSVPDALPVTCKFRTEMTGQDADLLAFARAMESAGASGLIVHARTADQMYGGRADWSAIARVVEHADVPVVGSGDIVVAADAVRMLRETGAAGVCVARGSFGDPWIFEQAHALLQSGQEDLATFDAPSRQERVAAFEQACADACGCASDRAQAGRRQALMSWYGAHKG